jgi:hypothetical protein
LRLKKEKQVFFFAATASFSTTFSASAQRLAERRCEEVLCVICEISGKNLLFVSGTTSPASAQRLAERRCEEVPGATKAGLQPNPLFFSPKKCRPLFIIVLTLLITSILLLY